MSDVLVRLLNQYGYIGIAFLIFIENIFPPIPSEVILLFGGFMTTYTNMRPLFVITAATIGSYFGACVLYLVGRGISKERLIRFVDGRVGVLLHVKADHIEKADQWFGMHGEKAVLICRCVPIVRSIISIPAGLSKMRFSKFSVLTIVGSMIWNTVLVLLGYISGSAWESTMRYIDWYKKAFIVFIILFIITVLSVRYLKGRHK